VLARLTFERRLAGIYITNLEHADDIILIATSPKALQEKMNTLAMWCSRNFMILNAIKSMIGIYGPLPLILPEFVLNGNPVKVSAENTYVGITLQSTSRNILKEHYSRKAGAARTVGNTIMGLQSVVGYLPPRDTRKLYLALMDPHLIAGCEISPDVDPSLLKLLEDVQHRFIRRCILRVSDTCLTVALFTETAIMPIHYRRLIITLKYLIYLLQLDDDQLARAALKDSVHLWILGKPGWISDIIHVLKSLPFELPPLNFNTLMPHEVQMMIDAVDAGSERHLHQSLEQSPKMYLLVGR